MLVIDADSDFDILPGSKVLVYARTCLFALVLRAEWEDCVRNLQTGEVK